MSTEDQKLSKWAETLRLNTEMVCRIVGSSPLAMACDPVGGWIQLGMIMSDGVLTIASWSCVQGENFKIVHERAMNVIESGLGSMR